MPKGTFIFNYRHKFKNQYKKYSDTELSYETIDSSDGSSTKSLDKDFGKKWENAFNFGADDIKGLAESICSETWNYTWDFSATTW